MLVFITIIATLLMAGWVVLFFRVSDEDWLQAAAARIFDNSLAIRKLETKCKSKREKLSSYRNIICNFIIVLLEKNTKKEIEKLKHQSEQLQNGNINSLESFIMPGYVLQREIEAIGKSTVHKVILTGSNELYGRKHGGYKAAQILAKILSYPVISISVTLMLGVILLGTENSSIGMGVLAAGNALVLVLVYGVYDELTDMVNKRRKAINRQFPGVISKLALLVTSGMIMSKAWKETAFSQETELYIEMRTTADELDNLVSPEAAYGGFISRCNTKETAKLASAIMQNQSKGNSEIGRLLKDMAHEVWQERRHTAKRDAEKANSKLMIPTMLLFLAILVMLMVPIAMNFSGI